MGVRWTLVEAFDAEGERFILAGENLAAIDGLAQLTERERQVAGAVRLGQTTKEVAYDLGISPSTARVLLSRALAKVGLSSSRDLATLPFA